jgi:hypothetical protein
MIYTHAQQACLPYVLPLLDGIEQGRNIYAIVPALGTALYTVLGSTLAIYKGVPFLSFGVFIALTFAARNQVSSGVFVLQFLTAKKVLWCPSATDSVTANAK